MVVTQGACDSGKMHCVGKVQLSLLIFLVIYIDIFYCNYWQGYILDQLINQAKINEQSAEVFSVQMIGNIGCSVLAFKEGWADG